MIEATVIVNFDANIGRFIGQIGEVNKRLDALAKKKIHIKVERPDAQTLAAIKELTVALRQMSSNARDASSATDTLNAADRRLGSTLSRIVGAASNLTKETLRMAVSMSKADQSAKSAAITLNRLRAVAFSMRAMPAGFPMFDILAARLDHASMFMWRFMIAAIPMQRAAWQIAGAFGIIAAGLGPLVKMGGEMEQLKLGFESMLGSADAAEQAMEKIRKAAKLTPFTVRDMAKAYRMVLASELRPFADEVVSTAAMLASTQQGQARQVARAVNALIDTYNRFPRRLRETYQIVPGMLQAQMNQIVASMRAQGMAVDTTSAQIVGTQNKIVSGAGAMAAAMSLSMDWSAKSMGKYGDTIVGKWERVMDDLIDLSIAFVDVVKPYLMSGMELLSNMIGAIKDTVILLGNILKTPIFGPIIRWVLEFGTATAGVTMIVSQLIATVLNAVGTWGSIKLFAAKHTASVAGATLAYQNLEAAVASEESKRIRRMGAMQSELGMQYLMTEALQHRNSAEVNFAQVSKRVSQILPLQNQVMQQKTTLAVRLARAIMGAVMGEEQLHRRAGASVDELGRQAAAQSRAARTAQAPGPAPRPAPRAAPEPTPEPTPKPAPKPTPKPTPVPVPQPIPIPALPPHPPTPALPPVPAIQRVPARAPRPRPALPPMSAIQRASEMALAPREAPLPPPPMPQVRIIMEEEVQREVQRTAERNVSAAVGAVISRASAQSEAYMASMVTTTLEMDVLWEKIENNLGVLERRFENAAASMARLGSLSTMLTASSRTIRQGRIEATGIMRQSLVGIAGETAKALGSAFGEDIPKIFEFSIRGKGRKATAKIVATSEQAAKDMFRALYGVEPGRLKVPGGKPIQITAESINELSRNTDKGRRAVEEFRSATSALHSQIDVLGEPIRRFGLSSMAAGHASEWAARATALETALLNQFSKEIALGLAPMAAMETTLEVLGGRVIAFQQQIEAAFVRAGLSQQEAAEAAASATAQLTARLAEMAAAMEHAQVVSPTAQPGQQPVAPVVPAIVPTSTSFFANIGRWFASIWARLGNTMAGSIGRVIVNAVKFLALRVIWGPIKFLFNLLLRFVPIIGTLMLLVTAISLIWNFVKRWRSGRKTTEDKLLRANEEQAAYLREISTNIKDMIYLTTSFGEAASFVANIEKLGKWRVRENKWTFIPPLLSEGEKKNIWNVPPEELEGQLKAPGGVDFTALAEQVYEFRKNISWAGQAMGSMLADAGRLSKYYEITAAHAEDLGNALTLADKVEEMGLSRGRQRLHILRRQRDILQESVQYLGAQERAYGGAVVYGRQITGYLTKLSQRLELWQDLITRWSSRAATAPGLTGPAKADFGTVKWAQRMGFILDESQAKTLSLIASETASKLMQAGEGGVKAWRDILKTSSDVVDLHIKELQVMRELREEMQAIASLPLVESGPFVEFRKSMLDAAMEFASVIDGLALAVDMINFFDSIMAQADPREAAKILEEAGAMYQGSSEELYNIYREILSIPDYQRRAILQLVNDISLLNSKLLQGIPITTAESIVLVMLAEKAGLSKQAIDRLNKALSSNLESIDAHRKIVESVADAYKDLADIIDKMGMLRGWAGLSRRSPENISRILLQTQRNIYEALMGQGGIFTGGIGAIGRTAGLELQFAGLSILIKQYEKAERDLEDARKAAQIALQAGVSPETQKAIIVAIAQMEYNIYESRMKLLKELEDLNEKTVDTQRKWMEGIKAEVNYWDELGERLGLMATRIPGYTRVTQYYYSNLIGGLQRLAMAAKMRGDVTGFYEALGELQEAMYKGYSQRERTALPVLEEQLNYFQAISEEVPGTEKIVKQIQATMAQMHYNLAMHALSLGDLKTYWNELTQAAKNYYEYAGNKDRIADVINSIYKIEEIHGTLWAERFMSRMSRFQPPTITHYIQWDNAFASDEAARTYMNYVLDNAANSMSKDVRVRMSSGIF